MKKTIALTMLYLICAALNSVAQITNYVKNPSFEEYYTCPDDNNTLSYSKYWNAPVDTVGKHNYDPEYLNVCATFVNVGIPENTGGYQYPRTGNAYIGALLYYDKTPPPPPFVSPNFRDYAQGRLHTPLVAGQAYCVSFWVVMGEVSGYAHNHIGAYLDNGSINMRSPAGDMITDVVPQVASTSIIKDTMNWTKIEGSFVATGNETHLTLGNFAKQADVDTDFIYWGSFYQYSYYLFDDISVIPIDLAADAGKDTWVPVGSTVKIGRVDDTTAQGLDCKWYHKGVLIDSGAIISVNASSIINSIDTYVVVQNICGVVKHDTVNVKTTAVGIKEMGFENSFSIYPNPSNGIFTLSSLQGTKQSINAKVYDLLSRVIHQESLNFGNNEASIKLNVADGIYIIELKDNEGNLWRKRVVVE